MEYNYIMLSFDFMFLLEQLIRNFVINCQISVIKRTSYELFFHLKTYKKNPRS